MTSPLQRHIEERSIDNLVGPSSPSCLSSSSSLVSRHVAVALPAKDAYEECFNYKHLIHDIMVLYVYLRAKKI